MRMLYKCNQKYLMTSFLACLFVVLPGCASKNQPVADTPVDASQQTMPTSSETPVVPEAEPVAASNGANGVVIDDRLSTHTVVPAGFEKFMGIFTPYRITIQQGNFVSKEMAAQLKKGMTREQVRFILGTPLLTDMFHADRWDYVFRLLKPNGELITSRVTVYFHQSLVSKIVQGKLPDEKEYLARIIGAGNNSTD